MELQCNEMDPVLKLDMSSFYLEVQLHEELCMLSCIKHNIDDTVKVNKNKQSSAMLVHRENVANFHAKIYCL